jgi:hypothetical protein
LSARGRRARTGPPSFTKVGEINLTNVGRLQGWVGTLILLAPR